MHFALKTAMSASRAFLLPRAALRPCLKAAASRHFASTTPGASASATVTNAATAAATTVEGPAGFGAPIKFSTSAAARSSPSRSLGAGQENAANGRLWAIMAVGVMLTGTIVYSCATETVDLGAPLIPDILRQLEPPAAPAQRP